MQTKEGGVRADRKAAGRAAERSRLEEPRGGRQRGPGQASRKPRAPAAPQAAGREEKEEEAAIKQEEAAIEQQEEVIKQQQQQEQQQPPRRAAAGSHGHAAVVGPAAGRQLGGGLVRGQLHHRARHRRVLQHGARGPGGSVRDRLTPRSHTPGAGLRTAVGRWAVSGRVINQGN